MAKTKTTKPDTMTEEAKQLRREYYKRWRKENPDKVRASQARYWDKKAKQQAGEDPAGDQSGGLLEDQTEAEQQEAEAVTV